jgi:hypothetical protein
MELDDFDIRLRRRRHGFVAAIVELWLYGRGATAVEALADLERKKTELKADLKDAGVDLEAPPAGTNNFLVAPARSVGLNGIGQFAIKVAIVLVLIVGGAVLTVHYVSKRVESTARSLMGGGTLSAQFWAKVEHEIGRQADPAHALPDEKMQKLLGQIKVITARWRPYVREIMESLTDSSPQQRTSAPSLSPAASTLPPSHSTPGSPTQN